MAEEYRSHNRPTFRIGTSQEGEQTVGKLVAADSNAGHIITEHGMVKTEDGHNPGGFDYPIVSFREADVSGNPTTPARYLRYKGATNQSESRLVLEALPGSADDVSEFRRDATFQVVPALISDDLEQSGDLVSFKSITIGPAYIKDGAFIRHYNDFLLVTDNTVNQTGFKEDATFKSYDRNAATDTKYQIGDIHPDGGIIFAVTDDGKHGTMVMESDFGSFGFADAIAAATKYSLETGKEWLVPSVDQLLLIYDELHRQRQLGGFQNQNYRSSTPSTHAQYPWSVNFTNGSKSGDGLGNKTLVRLVRSF